MQLTKLERVKIRGHGFHHLFEKPWNNIGVLHNSKIRVSLSKQIRLLIREPKPIVVVQYLL